MSPATAPSSRDRKEMGPATEKEPSPNLVEDRGT